MTKASTSIFLKNGIAFLHASPALWKASVPANLIFPYFISSPSLNNEKAKEFVEASIQIIDSGLPMVLKVFLFFFVVKVALQIFNKTIKFIFMNQAIVTHSRIVIY